MVGFYVGGGMGAGDLNLGTQCLCKPFIDGTISPASGGGGGVSLTFFILQHPRAQVKFNIVHSAAGFDLSLQNIQTGSNIFLGASPGERSFLEALGPVGWLGTASGSMLSLLLPSCFSSPSSLPLLPSSYSPHSACLPHSCFGNIAA